MDQPENAHGIVILAAGNSSRLGEPKQLLAFQNKTLVQSVTEAAVKVAGDRVIVVTGFANELIENQLVLLPCKTVFNAKWQEGMGSSVSVGLSELLHHFPDLETCIIAVSDQPFVNAPLFKSLIFRTKEVNPKGIIGCTYEDTVGTPVLFHKTYFSDLLKLGGSDGAKRLLKRYQEDLATIPFPKGNIDIDTPQDYQNLLSGKS